MKNLIYGSVLFLLGAGATLGLSAQSSNNGGGIVNTNTNPAYSNQLTVVGSSTNANVSANKKQRSSRISKDELEVPSAFRYLIEFCELTNGTYYLPKEKFLELTEQQQTTLLNNVPKFKIKE